MAMKRHNPEEVVPTGQSKRQALKLSMKAFRIGLPPNFSSIIGATGGVLPALSTRSIIYLSVAAGNTSSPTYIY